MNTLDATAAAVPPRPWYIALLLGASGWLAGGFLLVFVAMLFHPDSAGAAALAGMILLAAAWGLFKADRDGAFTSQLALALSFAGQCFVLFAMVEHRHSLVVVACAAFVLQAAMLLLMPNRLHRLMSALFALIAWALMWRFGLFGEPSWSHTNRNAAHLPAALGGWLITWLPVGGLLWLLVRHEPTWIARGWAPVLRPALTGLVVGIAFATLVSYPLESFRWWGSAPVRTDWLVLWPLLSAGAALAAVAAAFALGSRALMGACIVAVLLHVSHFYYALGTSLLLKSLLMLVMGAALLSAARWLAARPEGAKP
ncbi:MAG: DUF4401 domain-containing protein [Burkholderiales bacterium]|nr:DUF4401 domain-containing protein [Burkholderiales bacterium]